MGRMALYRDGVADFGAELATRCGFLSIYPLIVRLMDETGGGIDGQFAVARDRNLIESGYSQEPILVQYKMNASPFERHAALWVLGRCAFEDATRWLSRFPWLGTGADLALAVNLDYSLGSGAMKRVLGFAQSCEVQPGKFPAWVENFAPDAERDPFARWWGNCPPALARKRLVRAVRRLESAAQLGSLDARDADPPPEQLPPGCEPFPVALSRVCERLIMLRRREQLTKDDQTAAWNQVRAFARTLERKQRARPVIVRFEAVAARMLRQPRALDAAADRRAA